jgi:hypothetical protein
MRILLCIIFLNFLTSCHTIKNGDSVYFKTINIYKIDKDLLTDFYIIRFNKNGQNGIILSEKSNLDCSSEIKIAKKYKLYLTKINSTEKLTEPTFRLYANDIYVDGKLVFPKNELVYTSNSLKGLCIIDSAR